MKCLDLASTGSPVGAILVLSGVCLLIGLAFVLVSRTGRSRSATAIILVLLLSGAVAVGLAGGLAAWAAPGNCGADHSPGVDGTSPARTDLRIIQTSVITGMAPGVAAAVITGAVVNHGRHDSYVTAVTVRIASVTKSPSAASGPCDASDYVLAKATMAVQANLKPGGSAAFTGALIRFNDKSINQDACKAATVALHYLSN